MSACRCAEQRTSCDACTVNCARSMQSYKGSHRCNITADDADNGESPRLAYCFSCCNKQECSKLCEVYHNRECQQLRFTDVLASQTRVIGSSSSSSLYFAKNKNIIFNNTIEIQLAGRQKNIKFMKLAPMLYTILLNYKHT